jgi:hypothetical protein
MIKFDEMVKELMKTQGENMLDKTKCSITAKNIYNYLLDSNESKIAWNDTLTSSEDVLSLDQLITEINKKEEQIFYVYYDHITGETSHYFILYNDGDTGIYWMQSAVFEYCMADWLGIDEETTSSSSSASASASATPVFTSEYERMRHEMQMSYNNKLQKEKEEIINRIKACPHSFQNQIIYRDFTDIFVPKMKQLEGSWNSSPPQSIVDKCALYTELFACNMPQGKFGIIFANETKNAVFRAKKGKCRD